MPTPYTPTQASRFYSAPGNNGNIVMEYLWDPTALITGNGQPTTGCWRPYSAIDTAGSSAGSMTVITGGFQRYTGNATAYSAGAVISTSLVSGAINVLENAALLPGNGGIIQNLVLSKNTSGVTNASFTVDFWNGTGNISSPGGDGSGFASFTTNIPYYLGYQNMGPMIAGTGPTSTSASAVLTNVAMLYSCQTTQLGWTVRANSAYTPASGECFYLNAAVIRD